MALRIIRIYYHSFWLLEIVIAIELESNRKDCNTIEGQHSGR
jgi:hypothetical protein